MISLTSQKVKLSFSDDDISSHGGLLLYADFLEKINLKHGLKKYVNFSDYSWRIHSPEKIIVQKILSLIAGYEDNIDAQVISQDPVFNLCFDKGLSSQPTLSRLENSATKETEKGLAKANLKLVESGLRKENRKVITLDTDSAATKCYGHQKGSRYHGYYRQLMFHPLLLFCGETGDLLKTMLRHGSCPDTHKVIPFLMPVVEDLLHKEYTVRVRADAGMNDPRLYWYLEHREVEYAIRLKANPVLNKKARQILPIKEQDKYTDKVNFGCFQYKAESWPYPRRVYVKQVYHSDQLFPEYYFVLSNIQDKPEKIFEFYEQRGTMENYIKEGKNDLFFSRLSCSDFRANAFRLQVAALAYNINNIFRRFVLPPSLQDNMLSTLRWKIINLGCKIVHHARRIICKFGRNFSHCKLMRWISERLAVFRLCWT